ncbi:MAG: hypothetical protein DRR16_10075 [Candidatus Parabeggiatoa sp. nov. 3]|nr:MAG: hypothetical protein DRR00_21805 [Gammaproteobacteria bacterium]RKZ86307.1 MAG: hypothetical protein DRR16_10075 [Gammaproteobacteria bacterium]
MNPTIHNELTKLQEQLTTLDKAVKQIAYAGEISTAVVKTTEAVQKEYTIHLTNIQDLLDESVYQTQQQFNKRLELFKTESTDILTSYQSQQTELSRLLENDSQFIAQTQHLIDKLNQIDFSNRLDKLDQTISSINQTVQNTSIRIESLENLLIQTEHQNKEIKMIKGLLLLLLAISLGTIALVL